MTTEAAEPHAGTGGTLRSRKLGISIDQGVGSGLITIQQVDPAEIRELDVSERGIVIGEPLEEFQGILTGVPTYVGGTTKLMEKT